MSEFSPIRNLSDLDMQDEHEMVRGYLSGLHGEEEPGNAYSRAFWHGWRNGMTDSGRRQPDEAQGALARALVARGDLHALQGARQ
jgi:hypothetical protein